MGIVLAVVVGWTAVDKEARGAAAIALVALSVDGVSTVVVVVGLVTVGESV
jgi:hypothetical protein